MNLRKTLATGLAIVGLMASVAAPAALAQDDTDTGSASVTISQAEGVFNVEFCDATANLNVATQPNAAPGVATGELWICYDDTKASRGAFEVEVQADPFTNGTDTIASSNFRVTHAYNVSQTQWGSAANPHHVCDGHPLPGHTACSEVIPAPNGDVGDIGYRVNDGGIVPQTSGGSAWTANNTLDVDREVQFGYAGIGTISSYGALAVKLTIPGGTPGGTYTSNLELTVYAGSAP